VRGRQVRPGDESAVLAVRFSQPVMVTVRLRQHPLSAFVDTALHHVSARPPEANHRVFATCAGRRRGNDRVALPGGTPGVEHSMRALLGAGA
jgi:hypothetical protein